MYGERLSYHCQAERVDLGAHYCTLSEFSAESPWQYLTPQTLSCGATFVQRLLSRVQSAGMIDSNM